LYVFGIFFLRVFGLDTFFLQAEIGQLLTDVDIGKVTKQERKDMWKCLNFKRFHSGHQASFSKSNSTDFTGRCAFADS